MNVLPSMLIAATLIGGAGSMPDSFGSGQVILDNSQDIESALGNLGITMDSLKDCLRPSVPQPDCPDTEAPDHAPEDGTPDGNKPENNPGTDIPDGNTPENKPEIDAPDSNTPGNKPEGDAPGTDAPDENKPGIDTPETEKSYAGQVAALVNEERAKAGLPALAMRDDLNRAALTRAKETTQSFSHTRPDGSSFSTVLTENGISYRGSGENIAWGQATPEAVVEAWMNSEGHRANILNKNFTSIGVGYYLNGSTPYWAQLFTY